MDSNQRQNFGKLQEVIDPPNLIQNQVDSFHEFLQRDVPSSHRKQGGLEAVLRSFFRSLVMMKNLVLNMSAIQLVNPS